MLDLVQEAYRLSHMSMMVLKRHAENTLKKEEASFCLRELDRITVRVQKYFESLPNKDAETIRLGKAFVDDIDELKKILQSVESECGDKYDRK